MVEDGLKNKGTLIGLLSFPLFLSALAYQYQSDKINNALKEYNNLEVENDSNFEIFSELTTISIKAVDKVTSFIGSLVETLAVMIVTNCLIPILVFILLAWIAKTVLAST